jgi:long-chain acyl-CoA synthetase
MFDFGMGEVYLSYLPLAHIFERIVQCLLVNRAGQIGFFQGDTNKLTDDLMELKPTVFASVPRLYNRIYDKIMAGAKAKGGIGNISFNMSIYAF